MSSFYCPKCGKAILDSPNGYITNCEHYKKEIIKNAQSTDMVSAETAAQVLDWLEDRVRPCY